MIGSTIVWTIIEYMLNVTKTRVIKPMYIIDLFGNKQLLNKHIGIFLQGFQEGGVVTTFGLYFGDRIFEYNYLIIFHLFIFYIVTNLMSRQKKKKINVSRRQINTSGSIGIMGYITLYNVRTVYLNPLHFQRQIQMFFVMVYVCSIWTCIAYYRGFRNVEVEVKENKNYIIRKTNYSELFYILGYDVIFEIGIAYLTFYNWFILN